MEFWWNFGFQIFQIFLKKTHNFVKFFDKSRIHTIKNTEIIRIFRWLLGGKIEQKMLKILKNKIKQIVNDEILKMFCISNISIFLNKYSRIF